MIDPASKKKHVYSETNFGRMLYRGHVPMTVAAKILGVCRQVVYSWLKPGGYIQFDNGLRREALTNAIELMLEKNLLPDFVKRGNALVEYIRPIYEKQLLKVYEKYKFELSMKAD